jgi:phosphoglycerol transferase MdoB-like AlkP superfamily enzyme
MLKILQHLRDIFVSKFYLLLTIVVILIKTELFLRITESIMPHTSLFVVMFYRCIYLAFIASILSFGLLLKKRSQMVFWVGSNLFLTILMIGDLWYYRAFANFLSFYTLQQVGNLENLWSSVFAMSRLIDVLFVIDIPLFIVLLFAKKEKLSTSNRSVWWFTSIITMSLFFLWLANVFYMKKTKNSLFTMAWVPNQTLSCLSPIGYHAVDCYEYLKFGRVHLTEEQETMIDSWWSSNSDTTITSNNFATFSRKNLIFIQVESLENFVLRQSYESQEITPTLNHLLEHSFYFSNFYDDINNGGSADADLLANASVYPPRKGSSFMSFPTNEYNSLPKILGRFGYSSIALKSDKGNYFNWKPALTSMGFGKCYDAKNYKRDELFGMGLSDSSFLNQTVGYITQQPTPFYSFLVTVTSHSPFDLPHHKRELHLPEYIDNSYVGGYLQSVHYTDKYIGQFLRRLDSAGILDSSVVIIYGDHSGLHRYFADEVVALKPSIPWTLDATGRIPFLIYQKNLVGKEIQTFGGQIDIMPTILPLLGIPKKEYNTTVMGRDLLTTKQNHTFLVNGKCVGTNFTPADQEKAIKTLTISDLVIRSNYFGNHKPKR